MRVHSGLVRECVLLKSTEDKEEHGCRYVSRLIFMKQRPKEQYEGNVHAYMGPDMQIKESLEAHSRSPTC